MSHMYVVHTQTCRNAQLYSGLSAQTLPSGFGNVSSNYLYLQKPLHPSVKNALR